MEYSKDFWLLALEAENIAIIIHKSWPADSLASGLGLAKLLGSAGKKVSLFADQNQNKKINFLLAGETIQTELQNRGEYSIALKLNGTLPEKISYQLENDQLTFSIKLNANLSTNNLELKNCPPAYDLIITIGCANWDDLGNIFSANPTFFYETKIINIDNNYTNKNYGQLNLIDSKKASLAEIIFSLAESEPTLLSPASATCLLTGLICQTKNFKIATVTPSTLEIAAELIKAGADRELIINELYRKKNLPLMKLWGLILSNLNSSTNKKIVWSQISQEVWLMAGEQIDNFTALAEELLISLPEVTLIILIINHGPENLVYLYSPKNLDALYLAENYSPTGDAKLAGFITQIESDIIINNINKKLEKIIN